jgi:hypothetical protein
MQSRAAAILLATVLATGCTDGGGAAQSGLECGVEAVLAENCQECHQSSPRFGAPMPLVTHQDLLRPAVSDRSKRGYELMQLRTHDEMMPMPPSGLLPRASLGALDSYFERGLPLDERTTPCEGVVRPPPLETPELPCEVTHTFQASAGPTAMEAPYELPAAEGNSIQCFVFDSPFAPGSQGIGFAPFIDDERVLHHWIIWSTATDLEHGSSFDCTGDMPDDARFITGWAPGGGVNVPPADVGIELPGPGEKVLLQIHYWNVAGHADVADRSGVSLCATDGPERAHTAAVHTLGSVNIAVPPRTSEWSTTGECRPVNTEPVHILGSGPHMHNFGRAIRTEIWRQGDPAQMEVLMNVPSWDFNSQSGFPTPTTIMPGDVLRTTCTYRNPSDDFVYFGERTEDEMCFNFVLAYPAGALRGEVRGDQRLCLGAPSDDPTAPAP